MITTLRRLFSSKVGAFLALAFIALMGLAFALSDVNGFMGGGSGVSGGHVARVGGREISINELRQRAQQAYDQQRAQMPGLSFAQFVAGGGLDRALDQMIDIYAIEQYARDHGMGIDKVAVDAAIARIPAFAGIDGNFSQENFRARVREMGLTEADVRADIERTAIVRQLLLPVGSIPAVPRNIALPYASLLLEQRQGLATFIPASRYAPASGPTDAQLTQFYNSQRARYTVPERRAIRYALFDQGNVRSVPAVTDAEVAAAYRANAAQYAASESRRIVQVIAGTREVADRIAAAVRGGQSVEAAARAAGLAAGPVNASSQSTYAASTSAAVARAAFAADRGAMVGPLQVPLGFIVLKVESIDRRAAQTLADASNTIRTRLTEEKREEALRTLYNTLQDRLNGGSSVEELATEFGLQARSTPALLPNGQSPEQPSFRPDPLLPALLGPAFAAGEGDPAQIVALQDNRIFAMVEVARLLPDAPPPLADIRERVTADWRRTQGAIAARTRARAIVAAVEGGTAFRAAAQAQGAAGDIQSIGGRRINLSQAQGRVPPEMALLFSMPRGTAKALEMPGSAGWMVIYLDQVVRGDASEQAELLQGVQQQFGTALGSEYVAALVRAARDEVGVSIAAERVAELRGQLSGNAPTAPARPGN